MEKLFSEQIKILQVLIKATKCKSTTGENSKDIVILHIKIPKLKYFRRLKQNCLCLLFTGSKAQDHEEEV